VETAGDLLRGEGARLDLGLVVRLVLVRIALAAEVGVQVVDTAVDDADRDALALGLVLLPHLRRADRRHARDVVRTELRDATDRANARQCAQAFELARSDAHAHAVRADLER